MDNDLDRSIRLLEEAFTNSDKKRNSKYKLDDKRKNIRLSITLLDHETDSYFRRADASNFADETTMLGVANTLTFTGSILNATTNDPWKVTIDSLPMKFFEIMQGHSGGHDVLEIVMDLAQTCSDALHVIQDLKSRVAVTQIEEETHLESERNTWRLISILYKDRLLAQNMMEDDNDVDQYFGTSEKLCMESLFKRDSLVRESQLVIDWLESNAADRDDEVLLFSDSTLGWENTLHQLQSADTIAFGSSRPIVTRMDPDAPNYQKRPLHDLDMEDEKRLSRRIFAEVRCGKLEEAQKLCRQCGHSWRAAIFEGWRLYHDPNEKSENDDDGNYHDNDDDNPGEMFEIEGNDSRDIWKIIAFKYCKQEYLNIYDKASIAAFCGYINALLPVCQTWEDNLWAYMRTIVDIRVESEIRDSCMKKQPRTYQPLPEEYWAQRMSLNEVFNCLESSRNARVRDEAKGMYQIVQKFIILDEIPKLLMYLEEWIEQQEDIGEMDGLRKPTYFLRFLAHLVLIFDHIGHGHSREIVERVLEVYIKRLMDLKETQLIAYYISKLSPSQQVHLYAKYLEQITDNTERQLSLAFAEDCGLDVFAITKQVVENIRDGNLMTINNSEMEMIEEYGEKMQTAAKLTDADLMKINALDWLLFNEHQRAEALLQANAIVLSFLTMGKLDAAHLAFEKIPADTVEKILSGDDSGESSGHQNIVDDRLNQAIKEYLSYKAYLNAQEAFNEWFKHSKSKPMPPAELPDNAEFPEKVAHQHRESQYKAELERWKLTSSHLVKSTKTMLYNVLLFPEGWLLLTPTSSSGSANTTNETLSSTSATSYLRSKCIPEIVLLLYHVMSESQQHEECVQLADILASEKHCLYKVFSKEKLAEVLVKLTESSVALLNAKKDPWGNEKSA